MTDKPSGRTRTQRITRTVKPSGMVEVHLGSSSAKVYPVRNKNRVVFQVAWHVGGRRYRTSYTDKQKAIARGPVELNKVGVGVHAHAHIQPKEIKMDIAKIVVVVCIGVARVVKQIARKK